MPKKKIKPKKKVQAKKSKKRVARKARKPAKKKSLIQQIDEFDWRDVNKVRVGGAAVGRESTTTANTQPKDGSGLT
ncbi:MAG TPA: hypothetical protein VKM56_08715 [Verrucomicrobiae bacterium]|nr:hypothetical protein [Verrucomicrobiae bacterium]